MGVGRQTVGRGGVDCRSVPGVVQVGCLRVLVGEVQTGGKCVARQVSGRSKLVQADCGGGVVGMVLIGGVGRVVQVACPCGMSGVAQTDRSSVVIPVGSRCDLAQAGCVAGVVLVFWVD